MEQLGRLARIEMNVIDAEPELGELAKDIAESLEKCEELFPGDKTLVGKVLGM